MRSDPFGPIRTYSDALGCIQMRSEAFGRFWKFRNFSKNFCDFSVFGASRACAIYRRSPKCALSSHLVVVVVVVVAALVEKTKTGFAGKKKN